MAELHFSLEKTYWKEEVPVDITPTTEPQTVTPEAGQAFNQVNVGAIPAEYVVPEGTENITANGKYNVKLKEFARVAVEPNLDSATVVPTKQKQTVEPRTGYDGLSAVTVNPIPPEYVVPTGSVEVTQNGTVPVAGKATANVNVPQGVFPSGTKQISITQNGTTTEDVSDYADAEITVNTLPAKGLVFEDYDSDGYPHSARFVGTWTEIPTSYLEKTNVNTFMKNVSHYHIPDTVTVIKDRAFIETRLTGGVEFPDNDITLKAFAFYVSSIYASIEFKRNVIFDGVAHFHTSYLTSVIFGGNVNAIPNETFRQNGAATVSLYDFSHCSAIPPLYSVVSINCTSGCVIRIPAALSDTTLGEGNGWESATNWSALTNIVWEVV